MPQEPLKRQRWVSWPLNITGLTRLRFLTAKLDCHLRASSMASWDRVHDSTWPSGNQEITALGESTNVPGATLTSADRRGRQVSSWRLSVIPRRFQSSAPANHRIHTNTIHSPKHTRGFFFSLTRYIYLINHFS